MIKINQPSGSTAIVVSCSHHPYWHGALNSSAHNYLGTATGHAVAARDARVHRDNMHDDTTSIVDETQWAGIPDALQLPDQAKIIKASTPDPVNHPRHYTSHPSGVECITITEHFGFNVGNAIKYLWRAGLKSPDAKQDLEKALWYVQREIDRTGKDTP